MYPKCTAQDTHYKDVAILKVGGVFKSFTIPASHCLGFVECIAVNLVFPLPTVKSSRLRIPLTVFEQAF